jgi:hypothetical protein
MPTWLVAHERVAEAQRPLQRGVALAAGKPFNFGVMLASEQAFAMAWFDGALGLQPSRHTDRQRRHRKLPQQLPT